MNHTESSIKIYFTKEYERFRKITGNRQLNKPKIQRIRNDILKGLDVLRYCPILVKENDGMLDIIDGQHRFAVAKEMKSKVWYILVEDFTLHDIAKINSNTEKWSNKDYINCYNQQKNENYKKLADFLVTYNLPFSNSIQLLMDGKINGGHGVGLKITDQFKRGEFVVNFEKEAIRFAEACKLFDLFSQWNTRPFITAIDIIIQAKKCDFAELVDKFKADPSALHKKETPKEYLSVLEEIYNFRMRQRRVIF